MNGSTTTAGVDVAKAHLDLWSEAGGAERFANNLVGIAALTDRVRSLGLVRVGLEASGGYERALILGLTAAGLEPVRLDPARVRAFARFQGLKAKTDTIDARLIAAAAALAEARPASPAPAALVERLTWLEQLAEDAARLRTRMDGYADPELRVRLRAKIAELDRERASGLKALTASLRADPALGRAYALLISLPGVGPVTAATLALRMPELGRLGRGRAASLAGLAPFNRDSGSHQGQRRIAGGRMRVRRPLYMAALAALRGRSELADFGRRLLAAGKPFKAALTAVMRKMIALADAVLARGTPYQPRPA